MKQLILKVLKEETYQITEKFKVSSDEYIKLFKNDNFELVVPLTFEASKKYGANAKWCTTTRCDDTMFNKHNEMGSLAYLVIKNPEIAQRLGNTKYGLFINKPDDNYLGGKYAAPSGIMMYGDNNSILSQSQVENEFDKLDLLSDYYKMIRYFTDYSKEKFSKEFINEIEIESSERIIKSICDSQKFCKAQGPITFGQLKGIVEAAMSKRIKLHIGEGGYKAFLRLLPWFLPQLVVAGFIGATIRAVNKILKPALTETTTYKTWWGKTILRLFNIVEGELNPSDPFSKIFFVNDGLLKMLDEENKVKFARYISQLASEKPNDEPVPEYFVENELRGWVNQRFLLDPPLEPKTIKESRKDYHEDKITHTVNSLLKKYIPDNSTFETWFSQPYDDNERVDVYIEYSFDKEGTYFWKTDIQEDDEPQRYEGTIYLLINKLMVGNEEDDTWESVGYHEIPDYIWSDDFDGSIIKKIQPLLTSFNLDVDFDYKFIKEER